MGEAKGTLVCVCVCVCVYACTLVSFGSIDDTTPYLGCHVLRGRTDGLVCVVKWL